MNKKRIIRTATDIVWYIIGSFVYSSAVTMFVSANQISPGGVTGIATALNYLFSIPSGFLLFALNIPLLIVGFISFGGVFIAKTALVTVIMSISLSVTDAFLPQFTIDKILASVFGGILMGLGISIVMLKGASTGGVDILAKFINRRFRHITMGRVILVIDAVVIAIATFAYRNIESALYSVIALYASSMIMDTVLYGADKGKLIYIVTEKSNEICKDINSRLERGVTVLKAYGGYTGQDRTLLLCTVRRYEVAGIYEAVESYDPKAFIVVTDAGEIIGEGFKRMG